MSSWIPSSDDRHFRGRTHNLRLAVKKMYDACLFDYGNTLVEFDRRQIGFVETRFLDDLARRFRPVDALRLREAMDRLYQLPRQGLEPEWRELPPVEQMRILLDDLYGPDSRDALAIAAADAALQEIFHEAIEIRPGDRDVLRRIAGRVPIALVSNYPSGDAIRRSLDKLGIASLFRAVIVSGDIGYVKPHPSMFRAAIEAIGTPPSRTLFVGDRWDADLCGARDAGLRTCHMIGFTSEIGFQMQYAAYRPDHVARTLDDVADLLGLDRISRGSGGRPPIA